MSKTGLRLRTSRGIVLDLVEYRFPESREKFNVFVNRSRTQAARTHGVGRKGDSRDYTYLRLRSRSMYVKGWIDIDEQVSVS